ncbi:MAG: site-specific integrase [Kangiellaceae bacterium]|nr:site-specific integrase [Kangiellaceae bacterium]
MQNPSYLIQSRHNIYYFRYPLPVQQQGKASRISVSLNTRCPKEALRLAKAMEYHSVILMQKLDWAYMDHSEIMEVLKGYYAEVLEKTKSEIKKTGPLPQKRLDNMNTHLQQLNDLIEDGRDDLCEMWELDTDDPTHLYFYDGIKSVMDRYDLSFDPDSNEYATMKAAYKFVRRNHIQDVMAYNDQVMNYSLLETPSSNGKAQSNHSKPEQRLENVIERYLRELEPTLDARSFRDQKDCLNYLYDLFGKGYSVTKIDNEQVQRVKEHLQKTPLNRSKGKDTKGLTLVEQIAVAEQDGLKTLSSTSVNKYLGYFGNLFDWAKRNRFVEDNLFAGIRVKSRKKDNRRDMFSKDEIAQIIDALGGGKTGVADEEMKYWGSLIAIYSGARRNEIASLLPDDIKQDGNTGIWYFDITDEGDGKTLKTSAAKRIVPIHSRLISLGFLDYVRDARKVIARTPKKNGQDTRLLYGLTYTDHDKWGRKLGRWFNETFLKDLGLKTDKKTLHSLRHSFITHLSAASVDGAIIKSIVGHEANTVTTQTYTHFGVEHLPVFRDAVEKLEY